MARINILVTLVVLMTSWMYACAAPSPDSKRPTKIDLQATDKDVHSKLDQLHKVIDSLQETVVGMKGGYDQHAKENAEKMQMKFNRLSSVVSKLGAQKNELYVENKRLRQEKSVLVDKISGLEALLRRQAEAAKNSGAEAWLRKTAQDLKTFLEENGLEHFASPQFSPLIAGIVANGVVLLPLALTSVFLMRHMKHLSVLRMVMALNLFDLSFVIAMILSCGLLLGDVFEGLRHISEVNFVFIQLVLAAVFWLTCGFLVTAMVQNRKNKAWKYALIELILRGMVAMDYVHRVWGPVMAREDVGIAVPSLRYMFYLLASIGALKLTARASMCSMQAQRRAFTTESEGEGLSSVISAGDG